MPIRKSSISGGSTPSGTTADRPADPAIGDQFYNGTIGALEIYTDSGWVSSSAPSEFNISISASETIVELDKEYLSGDYTIVSASSDTTVDIYLFNLSNEDCGSSHSLAITATQSFNKVIVYGGTPGDVLTFTYKSTFPGSASTADTFAAPYITSITEADLAIIDDTTTIVGGNFDTDIQVWFDGQNDYSEQAKAVVYGSANSIVATRPDNLIEDNSPYTVRLVNPGTDSPTATNRHKLVDAVTAGGDPSWVTASGFLDQAAYDEAYSFTVQATDPDGGTISYAIVSGQLPAGLSLNGTTGEISGTPTTVLGETQAFVISATDSGGNVTNRSFSLYVYAPPVPLSATGGSVADVSDGGRAYRVHTFTSTGTSTFTVNSLGNIDNNSVDCLIVGGGGGGGFSEGTSAGDGGGGGGAGGVLVTSTPVSISTYDVVVGNGGAGMSNGQNSTFNGLIAYGGGRGGSDAGTNNTAGDNNGESGGSGGGAASPCASATAPGGSGTPGQGNSGGNAFGCSDRHGAGGGGAGSTGAAGNDAGNGSGGAGIANTYRTGSPINYGGGGGGGAGSGSSNEGGGGTGGGGGGGPLNSIGGAGSPNTGGGGGGNGAGRGSATPAAGGSGIVVIRYPLQY